MDDKKWERYGALGGIFFVVLVLVATFMIPAPPAPDAVAAKFGDWFREHHSAAAASVYVQSIGTIGILFWAGTLWRAMRKAEGGEPRLAVVALAGLLLGVAMGMAAGAVTATTALRINELGDAGAKVFSTLSFGLFAVSALAFAAQIAAVSTLAIRTSFLPEWIAWFGGLLTILLAVGGLAVASDTGSRAPIAFAAFLTWLLWIVCVSLALYRDDRPAPVIEGAPPSGQSEPAAPSLP